MTVFKDVRTLVKDAIATAVSLLQGQAPATTGTYNNGKIDVPAKQSPVVVVDKSNVQSALIDSGYYQASQFTGLSGSAPAAAPTTALSATSGANTKVCLVTDVGGINDKSFNATAWKGVTDAQTAFGLNNPAYLQSKQQTDYAKNIQAYIDAKCDLIVTVGFLLGDATAAAAKANPTAKFAIVDNAYDPPVANIRALTFSTDQAGFLAGYLAAGMTKTGKIGTFGGLQIPTVTIFEDGYYAGAMYYNKVHSTTVQVLGWDPIKKTGLFAGGFNDQTQGKNLANNLLQEGADIIMPVAGAVGLGAAAAIQANGNGAMVIGVDTDWTVSASDYTSITLTSVMKNMDVAVKDTIASVIAGNFQGGNYVGTLANNGVQIAPFHAFDSKVPDALKTELTQLKADIISGKVSVTPVAQ
ncbi:MAG: BMP family ABC transporter substrate-binding protein [Anaerolineaceae bacterium]|nr:BMP family ABC transporter substrate-binding protein [Anaerolineaceae bacterium]